MQKTATGLVLFAGGRLTHSPLVIPFPYKFLVAFWERAGEWIVSIRLMCLHMDLGIVIPPEQFITTLHLALIVRIFYWRPSSYDMRERDPFPPSLAHFPHHSVLSEPES